MTKTFAEFAAAEVARARGLGFYEANFGNSGRPREHRDDLMTIIRQLVRAESEVTTPDIRRAICNAGRRVSLHHVRMTLNEMQNRGEVTYRKGISKGSAVKFWRMV